MSSPTWPVGVTGLDHTADAGLIIRAPTLEDLFDRAAAGMVALVAGAEEGPPTDDRRPPPVRGGAWSTASRGHSAEAASGTEHEMALEAPDVEVLLVAWLREILHLLQVRGLGYGGTRFEGLSSTRLAAHVWLGPAPPLVTELKAVTYHALAVRHEGDGWYARVVFDI